MKTSLNKLFNIFQTFVDGYPMISTLSVAPLTEYTAKNWVYPLMWIDLQATTAAFQMGQVNMTLPIYVLDRVERDFSNYKNVMSSTLLTVNDFLSYFNDQELCNNHFHFNNASNLTSRAYEFEDIVCGWSANVTVHIAQGYNENEIPD